MLGCVARCDQLQSSHLSLREGCICWGVSPDVIRFSAAISARDQVLAVGCMHGVAEVIIRNEWALAPNCSGDKNGRWAEAPNCRG
eukprot:895875-Karenia_brevis.AAC.1